MKTKTQPVINSSKSAAAAERWRKWHQEGYNPTATPTTKRNMSRAQKLAWTRRPRTNNSAVTIGIK